MDSASSNTLNIPFYGLVAGAVLITWSLVKCIQILQGWKYARENGCKPPPRLRSHGWFGSGISKEINQAGCENRFLELLRSWHQRYGTTFQARMADGNVIYTVDPKNIQTMLALKFQDFELGSTRRIALGPWLGEGIFGVDGKRWEHSRALLRPNFSRSRITETGLYETHVAELIKQIPHDGSTVDLLPLFFRMTLDTATEFLFGESVHTLRKDGSSDGAAFAEHFGVAQVESGLRFRVGSFARFYHNKRYAQAVKFTRQYVERFAQKAIDYRVAVNSGREVDEKIKQLTDHQYVFSYELSKQTLDKKEITDQLLSILLAGRDTTAGSLGTIFFLLARRPDVWSELQKEVHKLNGRRPSFEDLKSMTYLTWVINESLRMYPIAPYNRRQARHDTYLPSGGGPDGTSPVHVPKGCEVIYTVYTMQRDNEVYGPNPDTFQPERWASLRPGWAYLPFNGGPRVCIGQQFALTEIGYTLVRIMQEFDGIENKDPVPWVESLTTTLSSANGTKVALTRAHA